MSTIRILLGIICLAAFSGRRLPGEHYLTTHISRAQIRPSQAAKQETQLLAYARKQLGVRERSGQNDGPAVEGYLQYVGMKTGEPWCTAFVSWVFGQAGFAQPRTAWSPALFPDNRLQQAPAAGLVFGIYFPQLRRIAHCGFVERVEGSWLVTIEGNTNMEGSREGDGVYRKRRALKTVRYFANWLKQEGVKR